MKLPIQRASVEGEGENPRSGAAGVDHDGVLAHADTQRFQKGINTLNQTHSMVTDNLSVSSQNKECWRRKKTLCK